MAANIYHPAPDVAKSYIELLPQFGIEPLLAEWAQDYARGHAGRCLWDVKFLAGQNQIHRMLNIGGAPYLFEMILRRQRPEIEIVTVDLEPDRFPGVEQTLGIHVIRGDIERPGWRLNEKFDCVVFAEILEHLRIDLLETLKRVRDHLQPGGRLYLTTPNGLSFWNIIQNFMKGRTGPSPLVEWRKLNNLGHMGHVREYSVAEVKELLSSCGFVIDKVMLRDQKEGPWPLRDLLLSLRDEFASEIVIVARANS